MSPIIDETILFLQIKPTIGIRIKPKIYPPVGPATTPMPPLKPANTGSPIIPKSIYINTAKVASNGFNKKIHKKIASVCKVKGTTEGMVMKDETQITAENKAIIVSSLIFIF